MDRFQPMNASALARDLARIAGIPQGHLSAVVERVCAARWAAVQFDPRFDPHGNAGRELVVNVVEGAVEDHKRGTLERRIL